ncbi:u1 zinc finger domain-containing protein [Purpureocillium lilacinum]|uniref:U1 small nuclear ribonucleoprotein C n=2 Tax=Purpureocillium lilacinum TaxID=33203 RepID=A0A179GA36_PURLI|nr:u1 zinc finger domain-containing protein [Purpureocillium lilacinum]
METSSAGGLAVLPLAGRRDGSHVWVLAASLASRRALWANVFWREARAFESDSTLLHHRTSNRPQRSAPRQPLTATAKPPAVKMPKFFCDYCDVYLTHDSMSVRKAHNSGRNHIRNVVDYYQQIGHEKAQSVIDSITNSYAAEGQAHNNPMLPQNQPGAKGAFPPPGFPAFPGGTLSPSLPASRSGDEDSGRLELTEPVDAAPGAPPPFPGMPGAPPGQFPPGVAAPPGAPGRGMPPMPPFPGPPGANGMPPMPPPGGLPFSPPPGGFPFPPPGVGAPGGPGAPPPNFPGMPNMGPPPGHGFPGGPPPPFPPGHSPAPGQDRR